VYESVQQWRARAVAAILAAADAALTIDAASTTEERAQAREKAAAIALDATSAGVPLELFGEVLDLVDETVARIPDAEVEQALCEVLAARELADEVEETPLFEMPKGPRVENVTNTGGLL
jgi:hypothetical protein